MKPTEPRQTLPESLATANRLFVALCDLNGQLRGKSLSRESFKAAMEKGMAFPPIFPITDAGDTVYPLGLKGAAGRLGDGVARIIPETVWTLPWEPSDRSRLVLAEMTGVDALLDPRAIYRRVEERLARSGYGVRQCFRMQCALLNETHDSVHAKRFCDLDVADGPDNVSDGNRMAFQRNLSADFAAMGVGIEQCSWTAGNSVLETRLAWNHGVRAPDDAVLYRNFARSIAQRLGSLASFMARLPGRSLSCAVRIALLDRDGAGVCAGGADCRKLPAPLSHFIGGLQRALPEFALMLFPNVNSYRRLHSADRGFEGSECRFGPDSEPVALAIGRDPSGTVFLEVRLPGADANPYLALACILGAGCAGLEQGVAPGGNARGKRGVNVLPANMREAISRFQRSGLAHELFGAEFVRIYSATRACQLAEFERCIGEEEIRGCGVDSPDPPFRP